MKITVFIVEADNKKLRKLIEGADNTFGRLGSGGYEVRLNEKKQEAAIYTFTACDCAPAPVFIVGVKRNQVWTRRLTKLIAGLLVENNICFSFTNKKFNSPEQVRDALFAT